MDTPESLPETLSLERLELNLFRGVSPSMGPGRIFGGQVIAQSLLAAYETVEDRVCHSLHYYFIRPGADVFLLLGMVHTLFDERLGQLGRMADVSTPVTQVAPRTAWIHSPAVPVPRTWRTTPSSSAR